MGGVRKQSRMKRSVAGGANPEELEIDMGTMDAAADVTDNEDNESATDWSRLLMLVCLLGCVSAAIYLTTASAQSQSSGVGPPSSAPPIHPPRKDTYLAKAAAAALHPPALLKAAAPSALPTRLPTRPPVLTEAAAAQAPAPSQQTKAKVDDKATSQACNECEKAVYHGSITCLARINKYFSTKQQWTKNVYQMTKSAAYHAVGGETVSGKTPCAACKRCEPDGSNVAALQPSVPPTTTSPAVLTEAAQKANAQACNECEKAVYHGPITCLARINKYFSTKHQWTKNVYQWTRRAAYHAVGGEALHGEIPCAACKRCDPPT